MTAAVLRAMKFFAIVASVTTTTATPKPLATIFGRHVETRRITNPYPTFTVHAPVFSGVCCAIDEMTSGIAVGYICDTCLTVTYFSSPTRPLDVDELLRDFVFVPAYCRGRN